MGVNTPYCSTTVFYSIINQLLNPSFDIELYSNAFVMKKNGGRSHPIISKSGPVNLIKLI